MSVLLALLVLVVFAWALKSGQFDRLDAEGERILFDEDQAEKRRTAEGP